MATDSAGNTIVGKFKGQNVITGSNSTTKSLTSDVGDVNDISTMSPETYLSQTYEPAAQTIMESYKQARGGVTSAAESGRQLVESVYGTKVGDARTEGAQTIQAEREQSRGFAANTALLRSYADETRKRVRDLEANKNELLLQNKMAEASQVSELILKEQTALTEARTNFLTEYFNIRKDVREADLTKEQIASAQQERTLNLSAEERAKAEEERAAKGFRTPEQQAVLAMAQQFPDAGITETDDMASAQARVRNSDSYRINKQTSEAELRRINADIAYTQAQTTKALTDVTSLGGNEVAFTDVNGDTKKAKVSDLTASIMNGTGSLKDLTPTDKAKVLAEMSKLGYNPKQNLVGRMSQLLTLWAEVPDEYKGPLQGRVMGIGGIGASFNPAVAKFESARIPLTREVARLYDVGMLSDQDVADYKSAMPSLADADAMVAAAKVAGLNTAMITPTQQEKLSLSVNPTSTSPTLSTGKTSTGLGWTVMPQ